MTGVLVTPGDAAGIADALDRLLGDPELRRRLGEHGRQRAGDYRWDRLARRVRGVYATALGRRGSTAGRQLL